ncbi:2-polyprenyl-6-hydroxyphenyl methylase / 3-demethylubiquinone-9 3-methyltransferase [Marchantia polymorpha subsp. ruderalis]
MWRMRGNAISSSSLWRQSLRYLSSTSSASVPSCSHQVVSDGPSTSSRNETPPSTAGVLASPSQKPNKKYRGSINDVETAKFAAIADTWWDHHGPFKPLHAINPVRLSFIRSALCHHFRKDASSATPLDGLTIVDVGCGGGLACEPLARMGAQVLGVDAVEKNIKVASVHAMKDPSTSTIQYRCTTAEQLVHENQEFDVVLALEVIEHVADHMEFCKSLASLTKKNGMVIISTINRSISAYGLAIVGAEYVLGWLPKGTHDWSKFVTPEELALLMKRTSLSIEEMAGVVFNPHTQKWSLSDDTSVNYIASSVRRVI